MLMLHNATIDCVKELRDVYEHARGEFKADPEREDGLARDDSGQLIPVNPIHFPLRGCLVVQNGGRITISVPPTVPGNAAFRLDEITKTSAPKKQSKGRKEIYTISGTSGRLLRQNLEVEHAQVTFTVTAWGAEHIPNQRLQETNQDDDA